MARELPTPGSKELEELVSDAETRHIYEYLYERREDPPTMAEVRKRSEELYGEAHSQTDRRLRALKDKYLIDYRVERRGRLHVYRLVGFLTGTREGRRQLSRREEAEVYTRYGQRCAMCGKNVKDDGVRLVIDHIVPLDWGGTNDPDNLQPLCEFHNSGKKALYSSFDEYADAIKASIDLPEPQLRIGELLKALEGQEVPVELITLVARDENRGDPTRRMRDLRALGWIIKPKKHKEGRRTRSFYVLVRWKPWPQEGPQATIARMEAERKRRKKAKQSEPPLP